MNENFAINLAGRTVAQRIQIPLDLGEKNSSENIFDDKLFWNINICPPYLFTDFHYFNVTVQIESLIFILIRIDCHLVLLYDPLSPLNNNIKWN